MPGESLRSSSRVLFPQHYQAPRELEHPLHVIREVESRTLVWIQPQPFCPAYELWAGEKVVATLRYRGVVRPGALAAAADGLWTFEEVASAVHLYQGVRLVGTLERWDRLNGVLALASGQTFYWMRQEVWQDAWTFTDNPGNVLLQFTPEASLQARMRVRLTPTALHRPEASLLALLGQYLMLARRTTRASDRVSAA